MIATDKALKKSGEMPVNFTNDERNSVKNVKLRINPTTIPNGLLLSLLIPPDKTIGSIGRIHGESIVTNPAMKANPMSMIIYLLYF